MNSVNITKVGGTPPSNGTVKGLAEGSLVQIEVTIRGLKEGEVPTFKWALDGGASSRPPTLMLPLVSRSGGSQTFAFDWFVEAPRATSELMVEAKASGEPMSDKVKLTDFQGASLSSEKAIAKLQGADRYFGLGVTSALSGLIENMREGYFPVGLQRSATSAGSDRDEMLWIQILASTGAIGFTNFASFMHERTCDASQACLRGTSAYDFLKKAVADFMFAACDSRHTSSQLQAAIAQARKRLGRDPGLYGDSSGGADPNGGLPEVATVEGRIEQVTSKSKMYSACIDQSWRKLCLVELIWSYWHEEGMLVQSMKAITRRFQNRRLPGPRDPLANLEIDPLRPLSNVLWGYVGDEVHRLSVLRRAHEYEHQYGLSLEGAATASLRPADRRSRFLEYFHNLLGACAQFFVRDDDNTIKADGFPILNAVRALHFLIAEGAHNQFGDLPETARQEMLLEQWIMARPETKDFLRGRLMVPYPEPWMDSVDAMKTLQGWSDASVIYFHDLGVFGEQILLSVRHGTWATQTDPAVAVAWARFWRQELQGYMHAYRAVTGVDLTVEQFGMRAARDRDLAPSVLLRRRLEARMQR